MDGSATLGWIAKPAATLALFLFALTRPPLPAPRYRGLIAAGLLCSLAGDVLLMVPGDFFLAGLLAFLGAHVCYLTAFRTHGVGRGPLALAVPPLVVGAAVLTLLWPKLGMMRVPVLLYVAVILAMCWSAAERWWTTRAPGSALALVGAVLFLVSDALLAINRFHTPLPAASWLVLGTYYPAQLFIAGSVGFPSRPRPALT
jgi:uncharacterized membrane protein YhhN